MHVLALYKRYVPEQVRAQINAEAHDAEGDVKMLWALLHQSVQLERRGLVDQLREETFKQPKKTTAREIELFLTIRSMQRGAARHFNRAEPVNAASIAEQVSGLMPAVRFRGAERRVENVREVPIFDPTE